MGFLFPSFKLLGIPIGGGAACATSSPVQLTLKSQPATAPALVLAGTYTIPPLTNCALNTLLFSASIAGTGNTMSISSTS